MIVLHATWQEPDRIHVWGETGKGGTAKRGAHPFSAAAAEVRGSLAGLLPGDFARSTLIKELEETVLRLDIPGSPARPGASRSGLDEHSEDGGGSRKFRQWGVPAVTSSAGASVNWLVTLPRRGEEPQGVALGDDLRWFSEASKLILELVARERYVPTAPLREGESVEARWEPLLSAPTVLERVALLARCMPEACRAAAEGRPGRASLVRHFVRAGVDGLVRQAHAPPAGDGGTSARWLRALGNGPDRTAGPRFMEGSRGELTHFAAAVKSWVAPVLSAEPFEGFRTCFRLEPPGSGRPGATDDKCKAADEDENERRWRLRFLVQPVDDPSAAIPAAALWRSASPLPPGRRAKAQDRLLADLARARRIFAPIGSALLSRRPRFVRLTVREAHRFLRDAAPLLNEGGAAVVTPPWWASGQARLAARAMVRPAPDSRGMLGLDTLVHFDLKLALGDAALSEAELKRLVAIKVPLVQMRGQWVEVRQEDMQAAMKVLRRQSTGMTLREALVRGWGGEESGEMVVSEVSGEGWIRDFLASFEGTHRLEPQPVPAEFKGCLRPYQERGLSWLAFLGRHGLGACLADDMGLGKTVQALAFLLSNRDQASGAPCLLVCPTSVLGNWMREAARFAPSLKAFLHHGPERAGAGSFEQSAAGCDLVVTSYALLHRDRAALTRLGWDTVILDEAQNVKNPHSKQAEAARALKARRRIGLTGTPVENHLTELWAIFNFLNPGYLGSLDSFREKLAIPVERWRSEAHAQRLRRLVSPFILRRLKTDPGIAPELPPKIETRESCRLTKEQGTLYAAVVNDMMAQIEESEGIRRKGLILAALTKLKQVCDHPALFLKDLSALAGRSGKLARMEEILEEIIEEGQRALVFTQFAEMGSLLLRHLSDRLRSETLFLHGGTPRKERERMIARFQDPASGTAVFLLSLKAGGLGLNLTAASHVIHFDRWWNPAVENQATDRAHRIGQTAKVHVHKFICEGTLEERIDELIESKKELAARVVTSGEGWITGLSTSSLRELFALRASALAEDQ